MRNAPTAIVNGLGADDRIDGSTLPAATSLQADGGAGGDYLWTAPRNDTLIGGPGGDTWIAGRGADMFAGGDGDDTVDYSGRTGAVTITLDGAAGDGEAGEGDNVGADVEGASGGSGNDRSSATASATGCTAAAATTRSSAAPPRTASRATRATTSIDTRDGRYDSIDCGPGNDTLLRRPG